MNNNGKSLLINAEAFGFGPTAAIASFFPYLRENFARVDYVGTGHSLDLQRRLPYDAVHDVTDDDGTRFRAMVGQCDVFFTALNFERAQIAANQGTPTAIYDPLAWYWPEMPPMARQNALYVAQDFLGVRQRLEAQSSSFPEYKIVSPIIPEQPPQRQPQYLLVNLGGLQNPHWPVDSAAIYARMVINACYQARPANTDIIVASSDKVAGRLQDLQDTLGPDWVPHTFSRGQMEEILPRCKAAVMTPGLGNIYDAGAYDIPTLFLPPSNDSQGQQLDQICAHGMVDASMDWAEFSDSPKINYQERQKDVVKQIMARVADMQHSPRLQTRFADRMQRNLDAVLALPHSRTTQLIQRFGRGGAEQVAKCVIEFAACRPGAKLPAAIDTQRAL